MELFTMAMLPLGLTITMFMTRNRLLGFACGMFWAIFGGYCYTQSVNDWDIYYFLFFASAFGMVIFTIYSAFALREKRDSIADEELEKGEGEFIDEKPEDTGSSKRTKALRGRAKSRRNK